MPCLYQRPRCKRRRISGARRRERKREFDCISGGQAVNWAWIGGVLGRRTGPGLMESAL